MNEYEARGSGPDEQNDPARIAEIEADIGRTRERIGGDLRTLGERLSPQHLKEEAKEVMTEAKNMAVETLHEAKNVATDTYHAVKDDAMETVSGKVEEFRDNVRSIERDAVGFLRENAIPLALIGAGLAWFVSNRRTREPSWDGQYTPRGHGRWRYPEERSGYRPLDNTRDRLSRAQGATSEYASQARDRARSVRDRAENGLSHAADQVRGFAEHEVDAARGLARDVQEGVAHAATRARDAAGREFDRARDFTRHTTEAHPLAIGAAAIAAGVGVGLLLPGTRAEREWLGPERQRLASDATELVQEVANSAKETAREVKSSLSDLAR
jgi:hypothetical protein